MLSVVLFLALAAPADDALAVFKAHCISCHGSQLARPKGKFGYVTDLEKIKADPKLLAKLAKLVAEGDMPPEGEEPLTDAELKAVKAWVEEGPVKNGTQPAGPIGSDLALRTPFWEWAGRFHVLIVHFPVALSVMAALVELWACRWWKPWFEMVQPKTLSSFCLFAAAVFSVPAVALGWLHAAYGSGSAQPAVLFWHRVAGTLAALLLVFTTVLSEMDVWWGKRAVFTRVMIFLSALVVGLAGHFGGMLTHGADFLEW